MAAEKEKREWQLFLKKRFDEKRAAESGALAAVCVEPQAKCLGPRDYRNLTGSAVVAAAPREASPGASQGVLECVPTSPLAKLPIRATPGAAGLDLFATQALVIQPRSHALVSLGMAMRLPADKQGVIFARSGLALRNMMVCGGGVIDQDYRGDVKVIAMNLGEEPLVVTVGMRIAQLVLINADFTVPGKFG